MSWIFFRCLTQSIFSSHLDMTSLSLTHVRSSTWSWVWCSPELVTFSFNGCCSLWCSPANIVIINHHNKVCFSSEGRTSSLVGWVVNFPDFGVQTSKENKLAKVGWKLVMIMFHAIILSTLSTWPPPPPSSLHTTTIAITTITTIILIIIILIILKPWLFIQPFSGIVRLKVTSRSDVERCLLISWKRSFLQIMKMMRIWWWLSWLRWWWCWQWSSPGVIWQEWRQGRRWQWWEEEAVSNSEKKSWNQNLLLFYFADLVDSNGKEGSSVLGLTLRLSDLKTCSMETKLKLEIWSELFLCHTLSPSRGWEGWGRHLLFVLQPGKKIYDIYV